MIRKLIGGIVVGVVLFIATKVLGFPDIFQYMFFGYAMLGMAVFMLLDKAPMQPIGGGKAVIALVIFYAILGALYVGGASVLPQYDPEDERGKIKKILEPKLKLYEAGKTDILLARIKALDEKAAALQDRLKNLGKDVVAEGAGAAGAGGDAPKAAGGGGATATGADLERLGFEQWQLQECYNCHKLKGEGGKKRGPELDNIGSHLSAEEIKRKITDVKSYMAEGFDAEYEKGKMPDKYRELMEEKDVDVLAAWLATMKNTSVATPKPIKKK
ncbi:MAG: cytochrome c [Nitrospiraceae bacterium]